MKKISRISISTIIAVLMFSLALGSVSAASAKQTTVKAPVILKINQYYVLYTTPDVPYIDKQNRFMMPLRAVSELLGAKVGYDAASKKATVSWNDKTVEVTINSKNVTYNGTGSQIDTVPVIKQGQIFIPARVLIDGLGIQSTYKDSLLTMTDEKFQETSKIISDLKSGIDFYGTPKDVDMNTNDIRPLSVELTLPTSDKDGKIKAKAQNISGKDMPKDTEDLRLTFVRKDGSMLLMPKERTRPAVKAGATYDFNMNIAGGHTLGYILAVGKTVG
ncbi:copper amine oxidase N-terminal domain-containing protein [Cohnella thermotolerans]|uniref:copper amine oxidase N-terminal domain-containing protein n=1 Tax=Cohnella thermotolerans TaxID=329858 RepID=UPI000687869F|nr:copper amine oxidase N-terminal domain-containing protein [Cohnella thermotolerans]